MSIGKGAIEKIPVSFTTVSFHEKCPEDRLQGLKT
jgi:hypothetical protein